MDRRQRSDADADQQKENRDPIFTGFRRRVVSSESSEDDFDQYLVERATPKGKASSQKKGTAKTNGSHAVLVSSDSDGCYESFMNRMKTPKATPKKTPAVDSKDRTPLAQCDSPVFLSDSDDDNGIVVKSTWRTRRKGLPVPTKTLKPSDVPTEDEGSPLVFRFPPPPPRLPALQVPLHRPRTQLAVPPAPPRNHSAPPKFDSSSSSDDEFASLLERLKRKNSGLKAPVSKSVVNSPINLRTPEKSTIPKAIVSRTEPRPGPQSRVPACKTPGCFLQSLSSYGRNFKQTKESLTSKLYQLYNTTVFDGKLPTDMSVTWNKKMRKTAGYCVSGQERGGGNRYCRIELSEKVCDSADRLRDTLVHEMCHAATWLINEVRDGHGSFWKLYARKATLAHPELPMVTRCHTYDIKYKFQYQCTRCKNTIGRHSKSLDTQRFVCALCTGPLVLLNPPNTRAPTPFANFVKENFGNVRQELVGKSHADVMRKLSADFAIKTKLSQS
ncbi:hypothetical protein NHX12_010936 [Muraenolepis orangiensis]|uniref:SprT-like domain-containing protein n=1 Tax=Muraenolepis orangiensis TaxID=630683 RepID=A0A9Q0I758_9TELE|nr:hypothetical protein NHX12_010936 [Muraenolepis orangiensis]